MIDGKYVVERAAEICRTSVAVVNKARAARRAAAAVRDRSHELAEARLEFKPLAKRP